MATLAEIRTKIAERLQDPSFTSITSASVDSVINDALRYYKYHVFWFNEKSTIITLNQGDPVIPNIPADFLVELQSGGLTIHYSNLFYPLRKISSDVYDGSNVEGIGIPYVYTYRSQQFEVYFYPNIAYDLTLRYIKDYADLVNGTDTNDFTVYADRMIIYNALSRIYAEYKQDPNMEQYYTARARDEELNLKRRSDSLTGSGVLTINSYLTT